MKTSHCILLGAVLALGFAACPPAGLAQSANPVADAVRATLKSSSAKMVAAANEMPADKFGFQPTSGSMTFGQLTLHIATSNTFTCHSLTGAAAAPATHLTATSPKADLVKLLQDSFDYCSSALANYTDADLGKQVQFFGGRMISEASMVLELTNDWADHYSQQAAYLRLNGMLPPTAMGRGGRGRGRA